MSEDPQRTSGAPHLGAPLGATPFGGGAIEPYQGEITLEGLAEIGVVTPLALAATQSVSRLSGERDERVLIALGLAQSALDLGHLGLRLEHIARDFSPEILREFRERRRSEEREDELVLIQEEHVKVERALDWSDLPSAEELMILLRQSPAVWSTNQARRQRPFVLDGGVLFTLKAWRGEARVARALRRLLETDVGVIPKPDLLWSRLFAEDDQGWFDGPPRWDRARAALYTALRNSFTIIHGGPGTGKTTLTQRILAALIEQYGDADRPLSIAVTAPTGKAAQRLTESIRARASFFKLPEETQAQLETLQGVTLHSLLGVAPGRRPTHHAFNPLPYDIIVVDECSMVDLWLLQSLVEALGEDREGASRRRLLLIGDPHQLPSVSAGAPLTELCGARGAQVSPHFVSEATSFLRRQFGALSATSSRDALSQEITNTAPIKETIQDLEATLVGDLDESADPLMTSRGGARLIDCVVALNQVRRVSADSGIHAVATAIQQAHDRGAQAVIERLRDPRYEDVELCEAPPLPRALIDEIFSHARRVVSLARHEPPLALQHLKKLCLLSPHYGGPLGVNELNEMVEEQLRAQRLGGWGRGYTGRPILVTQNHPPTGLVNGDIGVVGEGHWVHFEGRERPVKLSLLPPHRTVFAMSIHKSQGSEFKRVIMCIPPERSPIMTRELIYTGLTRAKQSVVIAGSGVSLEGSVLAQVERGGQLARRLTQREARSPASFIEVES